MYKGSDNTCKMAFYVKGLTGAWDFAIPASLQVKMTSQFETTSQNDRSGISNTTVFSTEAERYRMTKELQK